MITTIQNQDHLIRKMNRENQAIRKRDKLLELMDTQNKIKNEILRKQIIENNRIDLLCTEVLGYKLYPFHQKLMSFQYGKKKTLTLAPRDSGKSTICNYTKIIHEILKNPDIRIAMVSNTQTQAEGFLKEVKNHLESNIRLIEIFGKQIGKKWDTKEIIVAGRKSKEKESTITCVGIGSALVSKHFDLIMADDLVNEESARTELQRERQRTYFYQTLYPTAEPHTEMHLLGTRYHYLDLWGHFIGDTQYEGAGEFKENYLRIKALTEDPETGEYISFWPEKYNVPALFEKRRNMGTILFNAQLQNDTKAMQGEIIKDEYFRYYDKFPTGLKIITGVDLAVGQTKKSNKFAKVTIGFDVKTKNVFIKSYYERRALTPREQRKKIIKDAGEESPFAIGIESNAYQASAAIDVKYIDPTLNVKKVYTKLDKKSKGWKVAALFEAGRIHLHLLHRKIKDHFLLFDGEEGGEDDLFDAFYNAVDLVLFKKLKKPRKEPGLM